MNERDPLQPTPEESTRQLSAEALEAAFSPAQEPIDLDEQAMTPEDLLSLRPDVAAAFAEPLRPGEADQLAEIADQSTAGAVTAEAFIQAMGGSPAPESEVISAEPLPPAMPTPGLGAPPAPPAPMTPPAPSAPAPPPMPAAFDDFDSEEILGAEPLEEDVFGDAEVADAAEVAPPAFAEALDPNDDLFDGDVEFVGADESAWDEPAAGVAPPVEVAPPTAIAPPIERVEPAPPMPPGIRPAAGGGKAPLEVDEEDFEFAVDRLDPESVFDEVIKPMRLVGSIVAQPIEPAEFIVKRSQ